MGRKRIPNEEKVKYKALSIAFPEEDYLLFTSYAKQVGTLPSKLARMKIMEGIPNINKTKYEVELPTDNNPDTISAIKIGRHTYYIYKKDLPALFQKLSTLIVKELK